MTPRYRQLSESVTFIDVYPAALSSIQRFPGIAFASLLARGAQARFPQMGKDREKREETGKSRGRIMTPSPM
jgi:hypothetical protein